MDDRHVTDPFRDPSRNTVHEVPNCKAHDKPRRLWDGEVFHIRDGGDAIIREDSCDEPRPARPPYSMAIDVYTSGNIREMETTQSSNEEWEWEWRRERVDANPPELIERIRIADIPAINETQLVVASLDRAVSLELVGRDRDVFLRAMKSLVEARLPVR